MPSKRIYDCTYYYVGGTERGEWRVAHYCERIALERMGYVCRDGNLDIGPPETAPSAEELDRAVRFKPVEDA